MAPCQSRVCDPASAGSGSTGLRVYTVQLNPFTGKYVVVSGPGTSKKPNPGYLRILGFLQEVTASVVGDNEPFNPSKYYTKHLPHLEKKLRRLGASLANLLKLLGVRDEVVPEDGDWLGQYSEAAKMILTLVAELRELYVLYCEACDLVMEEDYIDNLVSDNGHSPNSRGSGSSSYGGGGDGSSSYGGGRGSSPYGGGRDPSPYGGVRDPSPYGGGNAPSSIRGSGRSSNDGDNTTQCYHYLHGSGFECPCGEGGSPKGEHSVGAAVVCAQTGAVTTYVVGPDGTLYAIGLQDYPGATPRILL